MATGTSGDERDDDLTEPIGDGVDTDLDDADAAERESAEAEIDETTGAADEPKAEKADAAKSEADKAETAVAATKKSSAAKSSAVKSSAAKRDAAKPKKKPAAEPKGIRKFFREVGAELRKVVTPTRKELWRYTGVVLGFLVVMMGVVMVLDFAFGYVSSWVFGTGTELFPAPAPEPSAPAPAPEPAAPVAP